MSESDLKRLVEDLSYVAKYSDSEHWDTLAEVASELRLLHALNEDLLALAYQYANDLRYPPTEDSRKRRLAAVEAVLAKVKA